MRGTFRTILEIYAVGALWLSTMLAIALGMVQPLSPVYEAVGAGPVINTAVMMAIAIVTASLVAGITWRRLHKPLHPASSPPFGPSLDTRVTQPYAEGERGHPHLRGS